MRNITEIKSDIKALEAELIAIRSNYYDRIKVLEKEAQAVRDSRGWVSKKKSYDDYYEQGRDRAPVPCGQWGY